MSATVPWRRAADGLTLAVRLTPKGGRDALAGLQKLIAKTLGIAPSRVRLVRGDSVRFKTRKIDGDAQPLARALGKSLDEAAE